MSMAAHVLHGGRFVQWGLHNTSFEAYVSTTSCQVLETVFLLSWYATLRSARFAMMAATGAWSALCRCKKSRDWSGLGLACISVSVHGEYQNLMSSNIDSMTDNEEMCGHTFPSVREASFFVTLEANRDSSSVPVKSLSFSPDPGDWFKRAKQTEKDDPN